MEFLYTIDPYIEEPIMLINRHIGIDLEDGIGIMGDLFQQELLTLDGMNKKRIQVWINSPGGAVMDGYNIYNSILKSKTPVDTYNYGIAASIAGVAFMAGRKRVMSDYASFMMHNPSGGTDKKVLDAMKESLVTMLSSKCGLSPEEISYLMDRTTWMTSSECFEKGLCTEIEVTSEHNQKRMPTVSAKAMWQEANHILNNAFKVNNMSEPTPTGKMGISLIANYLGLNTDATENSVLTEIKNRFNAEVLNRTKAEEALDAFKKEMDKMKDELEEKTNKYSEKCKEYDAMVAQAKKEKEEAEEKAKNAEKDAQRVKAKAMVEGFVKTNKIKADAIDKWTDLAVNDFDGIKNMLEDLPTSAKSTPIEQPNQLKEGEIPTAAVNMMAKVKNNLKNREN